MDGKRRVINKGDIYIEGNKIISVEKSGDIKPPSKPEFIIEARKKVILPGFINTHTHLPSIYVRGVYGIVSRGLYEVLFPIKTYIQPNDIYLFGLASCAESIYAGSTTIVDTYNYMNSFAKAVNETGIRAILGEQVIEADLMKVKDGIYEYLPEQANDSLKRALNLVENWHGKSNGRIKTIMAPLAPDMVTADTFLKCKEIAEKFKLEITTHLSQTWQEVTQVKRIYGKTPAEHLFEIGILDSHLSCAHCTYISDKERMLIKEKGAKILHCPRPYAINGYINPLIQPLDLGIKVGLGTDNVFHSMNETIRVALYSSRYRAKMLGGFEGMMADERPSYHELLELATIRGAEIFGLDRELGSIEPGKKADIIAFDLSSPHLTPTIEPLSSIVLYGNSSDIDLVIIDGEIVKKDGKFVRLDIGEILERAQKRAEDLWNAFFQENPKSSILWMQSLTQNYNKMRY
ncbi:MAG: amidohydrolase family protein [Candidatus Bathyarchaeia archaeon]